MTDTPRPPTPEETAKVEAETRLADAETRRTEVEAETEAAKRAMALVDLEYQTIKLDRERLKWADEQADAKHRQIYYFSSSVDPGSARTCAKQLETWSHQDPGCHMEIIFTSPGGSIIDGMYLFDVIQTLRRKQHTIRTGTYGMAASMAGILLQAGDVRWMSEQSWLMIHRASFGAMGSSDDVEDRLKWVRRIENRIVDIFVKRSDGKLTKSKIRRNWNRKDWWLTAEESLELGLVDEVRGGLVEFDGDL